MGTGTQRARTEAFPLYHGTTASFAAFADTGRCNGSPTGALGVFLSADPRVAAHFTLAPDVVDRGHDLPRGSRALVADPWAVAGGHPFLPGARVLECRASLARPYAMTVPEWLALVDEVIGFDGDACLARFRSRLADHGHDGIAIAAWDGTSLDQWNCEPCCEYDAPTLCVFDRRTVTVLGERPPGWAWLPDVVGSHPPLVRELTSTSRPPYLRSYFERSMTIEPGIVPAPGTRQ